MELDYQEGATPLNQDEIEGLIPNHITLQRELNECEANNILNAMNCLESTRERVL